MSRPLTIAVEKDFDPVVADQIDSAINDFNMAVTGLYEYRAVNVLLRDGEGAVQGGALGGIWGEWLYVKHLWVAEEVRGQGYGSQLLALAEAEAVADLCRGIYLETFDFQAYDFYRRYGYEVIGQVNDFPPGHTHYLLAKRLK